MASRSASMIRCMSSARPSTPSSATDLWVETTSSIPGRVVRTMPRTRGGVTGPARAVDRLVRIRSDSAREAQPLGSRAPPGKRRLAPAGVVLEHGTAVVVGAVHDRGPVVVDRVGAHHPHPGHRRRPQPTRCRATLAVANVFAFTQLTPRLCLTEALAVQHYFSNGQQRSFTVTPGHGSDGDHPPEDVAPLC